MLQREPYGRISGSLNWIPWFVSQHNLPHEGVFKASRPKLSMSQVLASKVMTEGNCSTTERRPGRTVFIFKTHWAYCFQLWLLIMNANALKINGNKFLTWSPFTSRSIQCMTLRRNVWLWKTCLLLPYLLSFDDLWLMLCVGSYSWQQGQTLSLICRLAMSVTLMLDNMLSEDKLQTALDARIF